MATYALISIVFILACVLILRLFKISKPRTAIIGFFAVAILTIHFEPLMISLGFFQHDASKLLGIYIRGVIPIEDMLYILFAAIAVPSLWDRFSAATSKHPIR